MNSPLVWVGSKRWLVESAQRVLDHNGIYLGAGSPCRLVELFAGGASMAMGLEPAVALLNDKNPHLINFWRHASRGVINGGVFAANDADFYEEIRQQFNGCRPEGGAQAERFYALNHWCFNGLWRVNKAGAFNVPRRKRVVNIPAIPDYRELMRLWTFTSQDFSQVLFRPSDVVFADPPYDDGFTSYTAGQFGWVEQITLAEKLAAHCGSVIATNKATERIQKLYSDLGFRIDLREGTQRMHHSRARTDLNLEMIATRGLTVDVSW